MQTKIEENMELVCMSVYLCEGHDRHCMFTYWLHSKNLAQYQLQI